MTSPDFVDVVRILVFVGFGITILHKGQLLRQHRIEENELLASLARSLRARYSLTGIAIFAELAVLSLVLIDAAVGLAGAAVLFISYAVLLWRARITGPCGCFGEVLGILETVNPIKRNFVFAVIVALATATAAVEGSSVVPNARAFALAAVCVAPLAALDVLRRLGFHAGARE